MATIDEPKIKLGAFERIQFFDTLPDSALIDVAELSVLAGRSRASLWRDVQEQRLAPPIKVGPNATRWRVADVRRYLAGRN